jgi:hypothetical protein
MDSWLVSIHKCGFFPDLGVNLHVCLGDVVNYASAQAPDFLDLAQKSAFVDWKHQKVPVTDKRHV